MLDYETPEDQRTPFGPANDPHIDLRDTHHPVDDRLEAIDEATCRQLLASRPMGWVTGSIKALPIIFPVNYTVMDDAVYCLDLGRSRLGTAFLSSVVALETDSIDPATGLGWSVQVVGHARLARNEQLTRTLQPGASHADATLIRIAIESLTGHRFRC